MPASSVVDDSVTAQRGKQSSPRQVDWVARKGGTARLVSVQPGFPQASATWRVEGVVVGARVVTQADPDVAKLASSRAGALLRQCPSTVVVSTPTIPSGLMGAGLAATDASCAPGSGPIQFNPSTMSVPFTLDQLAGCSVPNCSFTFNQQGSVIDSYFNRVGEPGTSTTLSAIDSVPLLPCELRVADLEIVGTLNLTQGTATISSIRVVDIRNHRVPWSGGTLTVTG